jgi:subtilisin-like proprotein convertase family protein
MKQFFLFIILFVVTLPSLLAQPYFQKFDSIPVKINSSFVTNPWAGGLNFVQPSEIDLNMDGIKDLFTFDKTGNKIRTFINQGTANSIDYVYDGSYERKFPVMSDWVLLADYNNDGKEDIFTYSKSGGGFDVYKNTSTLATGLQFQLFHVQQKSVFNPSRFNTSSGSIPDQGVSSSWDGTTGPSGSFVTRTISVSTLVTSNWHLTSVCLNINHPNDDDLIVFLVNPCGNKIRLIKNAGGSGANFTNTCFEPIVSNVIGSAGNNTAPFSGTYAPEAGQAAWSAFLSCANPNGTWMLTVGDQTAGNVGTLTDWAMTFYSPSTSGPTNYVNLYVSSSDIPAISDLDNDGDLDIVTFSSIGTYIQHHQNMSQEFYGNSDSLVYMVKNHCWGFASEDASTNDYTLHIACPPGNVSNPGIVEHATETENRNGRHAGSCQLCIDLDADADKEFIVGDISYTNLTMLTNGGTPYAANMTAVDIQFPENNASTSPVNLSLFPCAYYLDVNNDSLKDLVVTPNAAGVSENFTSLVLYENTGTNNFPVFQYEQSDFLQNSMIDVGEGAYPVFFDYDNDGLKDLFVGNFGYYNIPYDRQIAQFKNIGTATNPQFELITRNYNNLSSLGLGNMVPTFGDLDGDGDADMIIGDAIGHLNYFQNIAAAGTPANFLLTSPNLRNSANRVIDVGDFAAPQIVDIDNDGKNDIVIGGANGKFSYYHHTGTGTATVPVLDSVSNFFGRVKVNQPGYIFGYSYPFVFKQAGVTKLLSGSQLGYLRLYGNIDGNLNGTFTLVDSTFLNVREGERSAPYASDINNDGYLDLLIGNYQGGVAFYKGVSSLTTSNDLEDLLNWNLQIFPNPASTTITVQIISDHNGQYIIEVFNLVGQKIITQNTSSDKTILNTEYLKSGIYICKVSETDANGTVKAGTLTKKIIIQR